jgi:transcriptional regulator GlxA family with amidase domain
MIGVLIYPNFQLLDAAGPISVFEIAARMAGVTPSIRTIAIAPGPVRSSSGVEILARGTRPSAAITTLIVVGGSGVHEAAQCAKTLAFVRGMAKRGVRVASVCSGAYVLAEAGLLDGRRVTTHWGHAGTLATRFPALDVDPEPIFIKDGNVITSAGVTAGIDLALALVEEDQGRDAALRIARGLVVFLRRPGNQAQFSAQLAAQVASREPLRDVQQWITENPEADLSVEALAARASLSPRQFARAFSAEVGMTPGRYVDRVRLESARRRLEDTSDGVEQTARACGYGTAESMRRAFIRVLGTSPAEYKNRYGGNHADSNRAL